MRVVVCFLCLVAVAPLVGACETRPCDPRLFGERCQVQFKPYRNSIDLDVPIVLGWLVDVSPMYAHGDDLFRSPAQRELRAEAGPDGRLRLVDERDDFRFLAVGPGRAAILAVDGEGTEHDVAHVDVVVPARAALRDQEPEAAYAWEMPERFAIPAGLEVRLQPGVADANGRLLCCRDSALAVERLSAPAGFEAWVDTEPLHHDDVVLRGGAQGTAEIEFTGELPELEPRRYTVEVVSPTAPDELVIVPRIVEEDLLVLIVEPRFEGMPMAGLPVRWSLPTTDCGGQSEGRPCRKWSSTSGTRTRAFVGRRSNRFPLDEEEIFVVEVAGMVTFISYAEAKRRLEQR